MNFYGFVLLAVAVGFLVRSAMIGPV